MHTFNFIVIMFIVVLNDCSKIPASLIDTGNVLSWFQDWRSDSWQVGICCCVDNSVVRISRYSGHLELTVRQRNKLVVFSGARKSFILLEAFSKQR